MPVNGRDRARSIALSGPPDWFILQRKVCQAQRYGPPMSTDRNKGVPFVPPVVDRLSVRVIVDSHYERFLPKATHPVLAIDHVGEIPGRQMTTLAGEWGLSLHLESEGEGSKGQYLIDFGYTPEILNRNFDLLGIDAAKLDGLILSHGHRDHYGGLVGFVNEHRTAMRSDLSLYVGGETIFREKWLTPRADKPPVSWGALDRIALTAQNVQPVCCGTPQALNGPFTTGRIQRTSFEVVTGGTKVRNDDHFTDAERRGQLVQDEHADEQGTCYIVQGRGLVVISSCGHAGIVNTVRTAMQAANVDKLHAVIGGFHLGMAPLDYIAHTVDELEALAPDVVVPMHCTGTNFTEAMRRRMPDRLVASNLGTRFTFGV
jgi:7,8-dihydropterin-6-yl-methyl-4-(beta-D-ribofuranosyl)aminobenzene 5'-phosphate synthase